MKRSLPRRIAAVVIAAIVLSLLAPLLVPVALSQEASQADVDVTPPVIEPAIDLVVAAADASGAIVEYRPPNASDDRDGPVLARCEPASGTRFPLGATTVECSAQDGAGNQAEPSRFLVTVQDQEAPVLAPLPDMTVDATDPSGAVVEFAQPSASDNVDGSTPAWCDPASGSWLSVGATTVTCGASDAAGNLAAPIAFTVMVIAPPEPTPEPTPTETPEPTPTEEPMRTETSEPGGDFVTPDSPDPAAPSSTATPEPSSTPDQTPAPTPTGEPTSTPTPAPMTESRSTPSALPLPSSPPPPAKPIYGSGPIDGLALIWGGLSFPVSQEYGHTAFSLSQPTLYLYGLGLGLDGRGHPGLDIGMPAGTYLYSPVTGTVVISGGVPYYTYYGNGEPGIGELLIQTDDGDEVILGHMAAIAVGAGERVTTGQFVGLSGGENGDHLHLETRINGLLAVDPRRSFLVESIAAYVAPPLVPVCGETITITASADAWFTEADPWRNSGHADSLLVGDDASGRAVHAVVDFRLPGPMPEDCAIVSAWLELTVLGTDSDPRLTAQAIAEPWDEALVTWANQPRTGSDPASATVDSGTMSWDVTALVNGMHGSGNRGFLLRHAEEGNTDGLSEFAARESGDQAPRLVIHYAPPPPDTTIISSPAARTSEPDARFTFGSTSPDAAFECAIDGGAFRPCERETTLTTMAAGEHRLDVRAVTGAGGRDPTPARHTWIVHSSDDLEQTSG